jgi:ABC-type antimicrobial peptide transport system permease subunit
MTFFRLAFASLRYHRRLNVALLFAVATTTSVLTGALLVGDSMRGSLRELVVGRLGKIDQIVITEVFFRDALVDTLREDASFKERGQLAEPAILVRGSIKNQQDGQIAAGVTVIGCRPTFWDLGQGGPNKSPAADQIVLTERLASSSYLDVQVGDKVLLQLGRPTSIPADSPLGRQTDTVRRRQFTVAEVLATDQLGGFSLRPSQQLPLNAFVGRDALAEMLDAVGKSNVILVTAPKGNVSQGGDPPVLRPLLEDYGLRLQQVAAEGSEHFPYLDLTTERMLLPERVTQAALEAWPDPQIVQPSLTYLANWIAAGEQKIPYSTVAAIDSVAGLGPLLLPDGEPLLLADDEIVLNDWAAEDLGVVPGAEIELTFFEPETTHGRVRERTETFRLRAIVPLQDERGLPTLVSDPHLTPELKGVTDQQAIDDWDPPFPFDASRVRDRDEQYWDTYRATPKAFISRSRGKRLWKSRFGDTTSLRMPPTEMAAGVSEQVVSEKTKLLSGQLEAKLADSGLIRLRPLREQLLRAAGGTTPFGLLFLGFSTFLIASAVMLLVLLFRLTVDERAGEIGLLRAVGFPRRRVFLLLFLQTSLLALVGGLFGVLGGIAYAQLMVTGLRTWWLQAVSTPFLHLHMHFDSLLIGYVSGVAICAVAIAWSLWQQRREPLRWWLASGGEVRPLGTSSRGRFGFSGLTALLALGLIVVAATGPVYLQAGLFFVAGGLYLFSGLLLVSAVLHSRAERWAAVGRLGLVRLALRNVMRNPQRSGITISLVATATFLIMAVSAFRLEDLDTGGIELIAESSVPINYDIGTDAGRFELGFSGPEIEKLLAGTTVASLRVHDGDDASCLNLYRARQPRILGIPNGMPANFSGDGLGKSSWTALEQNLGHDAAENLLVPVMLDENTARYGLGLFGGVGERFQIEATAGQPITLEVVGLLKNSFFQGDLLISETQLLRLFPETAGYQYFLVHTRPGNTEQVAKLLEQKLADFGLDAEPIEERLRALFAVQNTYLSSFQSLGGLGLLLGTLGLVTVQLRNILGRRGELAVLQACGFRRARLAAMVVLENLVLLFSGLGIGFVAALLALVPQFAFGGATIPWSTLCGMLGLVAFVGLIVGLYAVRAALQVPILAALRGE